MTNVPRIIPAAKSKICHQLKHIYFCINCDKNYHTGLSNEGHKRETLPTSSQIPKKRSNQNSAVPKLGPLTHAHFKEFDTSKKNLVTSSKSTPSLETSRPK